MSKCFSNFEVYIFVPVRSLTLSLILFAFFCVFLVECQPEKPKPVVLVEKPERINEEVTELIQQQLGNIDSTGTLTVSNDSLLASSWVVDYYNKNKFLVTWSDKGKLNKQGDSLFSILKNADDYGLMPEDYHFKKIDSLFKTEKDTSSKKYDAVKIAKADILLTDAFFVFAVHVSKGRLNKDTIIREWKASQMPMNMVALLDSAVKANVIHQALDSLQPKNPQYFALKTALKKFKDEFKNSNWDSLATRESDSLNFNQRLKKRLIASHDYKETEGLSDSMRLIKAIKNFQHHHNLDEDGKVGKLTFQALQGTKTDYMNQIKINMERWRLYNYPHDKQFVMVNIPKYQLRVIEEDTLVIESRVIVGQPKHKTPILNSVIKYFIIYPYWNVPYKIATEEILPILKRDTSYLRRKNFDVLNGYGEIITYTPINWKRYHKKYFPFRIRQRMGDDNSLGILKFNFDNKYGVYLHDTDGRRLFKREMRALSHGCIRLEKFIDFAHFLIRDDSVRYPFDSLKVDILKEEQKYKYLKKPLPIYVNYFTAEVDEDKELFLFIDIYKRDERMLAALKQKSVRLIKS